MTEISTGWIVVTYACFIVTTLCMAVMLGGMFYALRRAERVLALASHVGLPRAYELTDNATRIASRIERILQKIDSESDATVVRVEQVLDHVEGALENVEYASERIHHTVQGTSEGLHRVKHNPMTKRILVGAGAIAAATCARSAYDHIVHGGGRNGNGKR